tara:strand:- start:51 stop:671 length:621 start_codon:yes stop_codon:yes gene_type:complete
MKKLLIISSQIKNNTYSYTGKGSFEAIVNKNKDLILQWLEELLPLQNQIEILLELQDIKFQKRNYTRILTKVFPEEYREFVCLNILVRDANILAQYYNEEYNITILYDNLIKDKYLKYPGKYDKYVEFLIFQKFVMMYRDELIFSLNNEHQSLITSKKEQREEATPTEIQNTPLLADVESEQTIEVAKAHEDKDVNWTQLLLGKLK